MLVLTRRRDESIVLAEGLVTITVLSIRSDSVRIGIDAPREMAVHRSEVQELINQKKHEESDANKTGSDS